MHPHASAILFSLVQIGQQKTAYIRLCQDARKLECSLINTLVPPADYTSPIQTRWPPTTQTPRSPCQWLEAPEHEHPATPPCATEEADTVHAQLHQAQVAATSMHPPADARQAKPPQAAPGQSAIRDEPADRYEVEGRARYETKSPPPPHRPPSSWPDPGPATLRRAADCSLHPTPSAPSKRSSQDEWHLWHGRGQVQASIDTRESWR